MLFCPLPNDSETLRTVRTKRQCEKGSVRCCSATARRRPITIPFEQKRKKGSDRTSEHTTLWYPIYICTTPHFCDTPHTHKVHTKYSSHGRLLPSHLFYCYCYYYTRLPSPYCTTVVFYCVILYCTTPLLVGTVVGEDTVLTCSDFILPTSSFKPFFHFTVSLSLSPLLCSPFLCSPFPFCCQSNRF